MLSYDNLSPGQRLSLACASIAALVVIVFASIATINSPRQTELQQSGDIIASQLAHSAAPYIVSHDRLALQTLLHELKQSPLILAARIEDAGHSLIVESGGNTVDANSVGQFSAPIEVHDSIVGHATVLLRGAQAPAMSAATILLLGVLVFAAVAAFASLRLRALDQSLQRLAATVSAIVPGAKGTPELPLNSDIDQVCRALQQRAPMHPAPRRAVLALRLAKLANDSLEKPQLAAQCELVEHVAARWQGQLSEDSDGWQLLFTTGADTARRMLASARYLHDALDGHFDYAMALGLEAEFGSEDGQLMRRFNWRRLRDATSQLASTPNALVLPRLVLCDPGIHQYVTVEQDESEDYRVTGFCDQPEHRAPRELHQHPRAGSPANDELLAVPG